MFAILFVMVAATALGHGQIDRAHQPDPVAPGTVEKNLVGLAPSDDPHRDQAATAQRLGKLWIPLPCTRVGARMVC